MQTAPRVALVTGASSGIGRAAALALVGAGFAVVGTSRDAVNAEPLAGVTFLDLDVASDESVLALVGEVIDLLDLQERTAERVSKAPPLSPLEASGREDELADWLDDHGAPNGWQIAPTFVQGGLDVDWLEQIATAVDEQGILQILPSSASTTQLRPSC